MAYIHNIITIDSPINGISSSLTNETVSKVLTDLFDASGDAGRGLQHKQLIYQLPSVPTDSFLDDLKRDPLRVDMICIGNVCTAARGNNSSGSSSAEPQQSARTPVYSTSSAPFITIRVLSHLRAGHCFVDTSFLSSQGEHM